MIRTEEHGGIILVTIDRPPVNAVDHQSVLDLMQAIKRVKENERAKGLVLTGSGDCFCAGVDVRAFREYSPEVKREMILDITRMTHALLSLSIPVVAGVNGTAMGGGMVLALCADARVSLNREQRYWGLPEARAGIPFPAGPMEIIQAELPAPLLRQLTLLCRTFTPQELSDAGVVDEMCRPKEIVRKSIETCQEMAALPAFGAVKDQLKTGLREKVGQWMAAGDDPLLQYIR